MENHTASQFTKVIDMKCDEIYGSIHITIEPGNFCIFDRNMPSNGLHRHTCYEICLVTGGSGEFIHGREIYQVDKGTVFIADPGVLHEIRLAKGSNRDYADNLFLVVYRVHISLNAESTSQNYEETMLQEFLSSHAIISKTQKHLFSYLYFIETYTTQNTCSNYGLYQIVRSLCLELLFSLVKTKGFPYRKQIPYVTIVDQTIKYIGDNIHRRIYLSEIAANACTSERNLQLIFRKQMDKSITDYINIRKTAVAAGYLKMNFKISDVSNLLGISDTAQFSRLFKKYYGISPKKFQSIHSPGGMVSEASYAIEKINP